MLVAAWGQGGDGDLRSYFPFFLISIVCVFVLLKLRRSSSVSEDEARVCL
jgi:hypothetical protein